MKINDRVLCHYAGCPQGFDKEGSLCIRGEANKSFQKRHFVLKGNLLFYFEKKGDKDPLGLIVLEGCSIELAEEEQEMFAFKIVFHGEGRRSYILGTESQEMLEDWMKLLACAPYDYMKLMVIELQQQLRELEEVDRMLGGGGGGAPNLSALPSSRMNPFDNSNEDALFQSDSYTQTWKSIHAEYGRKILRDRSLWAKNLEESSSPITMKDDDTICVRL
eukprot:TRINITY_DN1890_c0_g1_i2.p1 TRINITY_DN1890_c0_g1~~TRINITY_DN1890_c0_g1_i2.p1  ORF type:complete len:219 (-),score=78.37 TRINITY_DN1890_c0_g1_i2:283-939(-)